MTDGIDHFAWAESAAEQIDKRIGARNATVNEIAVIAAQGIVHGLLAVADELAGIRELIETTTEKPQTAMEHPYTSMDITTRPEKPFPGP